MGAPAAVGLKAQFQMGLSPLSRSGFLGYTKTP